MILPDKGPELSRRKLSRPERSEKFVGIDRVGLEFQDKRFDVGGGSLNRTHATHIKNRITSLIPYLTYCITTTERRLHDAPGQSQGSKTPKDVVATVSHAVLGGGIVCGLFPSFVRRGEGR